MSRWNPFLQRGAHPAPLEIPPVGLGPELATARLVLLNRLRQRGVPDRIVAAFAAIPRERFVPDDLRADSYEDRALPIGEEQTISQPYMIARMLVELALRPEDRVLDIGTGSGYQAALLGQLCREVVSIEVRPTLLERARRTLATAGASNVTCHLGNGRLGWSERPYDSPRLLVAVLDAARAVDAGAIAAACTDKAKLPERIRAARVAAVSSMLEQAREKKDQC